MISRLAIPALALAVASPAVLDAASLRDCDQPEANARWLAFPERIYANGAIRFLHLDTYGEPACCSSHLMVLYPDPAFELGDACTLISLAGANGFAGANLKDARSAYDPARGLSVTVPVSAYDAASGSSPFKITVTINQQTGEITVEGAPP